MPQLQDISSSQFVTPEVASQTAAWSAPVLLREGRINALYQVSHHGQRFLLKALRPEYRNSALYRQMLQHEFELGVTLDHPHVVRTLDKGYMPEIGDYIQLEWVEGQTLGEWLSDGPSRAQRRRVLEQLVDAMGYLHRHQIVHRDLKPANIMVTTNGNNVRLIDFGLSDKDSYETFKQPAGSSGYVAPEVLAGEEADNRADIYALGQLIRLLCGRRYACVSAKCVRNNRERRYANTDALWQAVRLRDRVVRWLPLVVLLLGLCVSVGLMIRSHQQTLREQQLILQQQDSLLVLREQLDIYQQEERMQLEAVRQVDSLFSSYVELPFKRGQFQYIQDVTEAMESARKKMEQMVGDVQDEMLRNKVRQAAYNEWIACYNRFIEKEQPYNKLPPRLRM